jgi:DNA-binding XRE family transcriptional regulator
MEATMDVKFLREKCGWSVSVMAQLLGVAANTVYRWEREPARSERMEPLQRAFLTLIDQNPITVKEGEHIEAAVRTGGSLSGIYELLKICREHQHLQQKRCIGGAEGLDR